MDCYMDLYNKLNVDLGQAELYRTIHQFFRERYGDDEFIFYAAGYFLIHTIPFFLFNFMLYFTEWMVPSFVDMFKFQPKKRPSHRQIWGAIFHVAKIHLFSPLSIITFFSLHTRYSDKMFDDDAVPGVLTLAWQVFASYVITDFLFYWCHRLLHQPMFYAPIHKKHHEFKVTVGFASEYAHPVEWLVGNLIPVVIGPILLKSHFVLCMLYTLMAIIGTSIHHSGIRFPLVTDEGFHDFHHSHNVGNYGSMPYLDFLFGTDKHWRNFRALKASTEDD